MVDNERILKDEIRALRSYTIGRFFNLCNGRTRAEEEFMSNLPLELLTIESYAHLYGLITEARNKKRKRSSPAPARRETNVLVLTEH